MSRKLHNTEPGYVAERANPVAPGTKVVIYIAAEQGIDVDSKYAIVCDAHGTIGEATSVVKSRVLMKAPGEFCSECEMVEFRLG